MLVINKAGWTVVWRSETEDFLVTDPKGHSKVYERVRVINEGHFVIGHKYITDEPIYPGISIQCLGDFLDADTRNESFGGYKYRTGLPVRSSRRNNKLLSE